jgi:hypothetical protein
VQFSDPVRIVAAELGSVVERAIQTPMVSAIAALVDFFNCLPFEVRRPCDGYGHLLIELRSLLAS